MADAPDLFDALPSPAALIAWGGRIARVNAPGRALLGDSLVGLHHITALRQPALLDAIERSVESGPQEVRFLARQEDGGVWLARAVRLADRSVLVTFEDRSAGEAADRARRDFVANVSHELRTPLTALLGFIETLRGPARDDAAARDRFLAVMEREARRMERLVRDLLSLGRVEAEARVRPRGIVNLGDVASRVREILRPLAEARGIEILAEAPAGATIRGDEDQIVQVVTNLVENAIKYGSDGGCVRIEVRHSPSDPQLLGSSVVLTVTDDGPGIAPHHLPRLTERFYRVDTHRSRESGGTGLGLAIVKHVVARHRGRLRIESTPGEGSTFSVHLPAV